MGRPISKTTKFILALPRSLSAKEVLTKAKANGHKTTESNIYRVRRLHGASKKKPHAVPPSTPKAAGGPKVLAKSDYARSFSSATSAKEFVANAKAAGIKLDVQNVYKSHSRSKPSRRKASVGKPAPVVRTTNGSPERAEDLLRAVAAELGLGHAMEILQSERSRVRAVLGG